MSNNLHVYLDRIPLGDEISSFLTTLGFKYDRTWTSPEEEDPTCFFWTWQQHPLSSGGVELQYFSSAFHDNVRFSTYPCSIVLKCGHGGSPIDLAMLDITAVLLLRQCGGTLHNPQRIDRKFANLFVCGINNTQQRN